MEVFDLLNIIVYYSLLSVHSILMRFVEISFFSQLLPGAFSLLSSHLRLS